MAAVPGTVTLDDGWEKALGGDECPVCQARLKAGERAIALQQCGHAFHLACLRPWLTKASATCPVCRAEVATPSAAAIAAAATDKREGQNLEEEGGNLAWWPPRTTGTSSMTTRRKRAVDQLLPAVELRLQQHDQPELGDAGRSAGAFGGDARVLAKRRRRRRGSGRGAARDTDAAQEAVLAVAHIVRAEKVGG